MALEKTVLNEKIVSDLLFRNYGISLIFAKKLKLGSANCFQVYDGNATQTYQGKYLCQLPSASDGWRNLYT